VATTAALHTARRLGLTPVLWTCWGRDWTPNATPDRVFRSVRARLSGGGTILLHDSDHCAAPRSWEVTLAALPSILTLCQARGFDVGPLGEHAVRPA
jgi:peptidoglycan/xylan/chitin deacetylase (PgdA/CDA1 family)